MSLDTLARDRLVHLVITLRDGRRAWQAGVERQENPTTKQSFTAPRWNDDPHMSRPLPLEMAIICQRRWKQELNLLCRLSLEPYSEFIDEAPQRECIPWQHVDHFVHVDPEETIGFWVRAVNTPQGKQFCLRFENPDLAEQSVFVDLSEGPAGCVEKARRLGFLPNFEAPKPSPFRAQREAAARQAAEEQQVKDLGRVRPGSCR